MSGAEAKKKKLEFIGVDMSSGKPIFKYKPIGETKDDADSDDAMEEDMDSDDKGSDSDSGEDVNSDTDDSECDMACHEDHMIERLASRDPKVLKREFIDGWNASFGVDSTGWSRKHAIEEAIIQVSQKTDDEGSDEE